MAKDKSEYRLDKEQYEMLLRCSEIRHISEWNNWRKENPKVEIWLEGAQLVRAHLEDANLMDAHLEGTDLWEAHLEGADLRIAHLEGVYLSDAHLEGADLTEAHLEGAKLAEAHLRGANLHKAHLEGANLFEAHLEGALLSDAHLEGADLLGAYLEGANLTQTHLEGAKLFQAHLEGAHLQGADLTGTVLSGAYLQGIHAGFAIVDGRTEMLECEIDRQTNFCGVGLGNVIIRPAERQLLEHNIRRISWKEWYTGQSERRYVRALRQSATLPVRWFWFVSNYGLSTGRIIFTFFAIAIIFAAAYYRSFDLVSFIGDQGRTQFESFWHAVYFSVVTMTTLGFGDIAANPKNWVGQGVLMLQVCLGYVLLGALVTRFAILFTAGGPAGKYAEMSEETKQLLGKVEQQREAEWKELEAKRKKLEAD